MPEVMQWGPFMVKMDWLLYVAAGIAAYVFMRKILKGTANENKPLIEKVFDSLLIWFFVWKFSPLLFNPAVLWTSPLLVLMMSGSSFGILLGFTVATAYFLIKLRRMGVPKLFASDVLGWGIVSSVIAYHALGWRYGATTTMPWGISIENTQYKYHPINLYVLAFSLPLLIFFWKKRYPLGSGKMTSSVLIFMGIGFMTVSLFKLKEEAVFGLSVEQVLYFLCTISGLLLNHLLLRRDRHHLFKLP